MESRHDDIQTKAAQAVAIFVLDSRRRSQVSLVISFFSNLIYLLLNVWYSGLQMYFVSFSYVVMEQ